MQDLQKIEKAFTVVFAKVMDFVDDKVHNATPYDKKSLRDAIYSVRDNLKKELIKD